MAELKTARKSDPQTDAILAFLGKAAPGKIAAVEAILASPPKAAMIDWRAPNPFEVVGPDGPVDPKLGRFSRVSSDSDIRRLEGQDFVRIESDAYKMRGCPGGTLMFRPAVKEAEYAAQRKARDAARRAPKSRSTERHERHGQVGTITHESRRYDATVRD